MSENQYLHFTIGPVQSFVAQSRRTRDLLAGSFLLSYLSGHAMMAIIRPQNHLPGGNIVFPHVHQRQGEKMGLRDSLLQAINRSLDGEVIGEGPWVGSLPNRFKAEIPAGEDPVEYAIACEKAVKKAWKRIADAVWEKIAPAAIDRTKEIWDRQVDHFWDIAWVVGEDSDLLDRRKNWRSYLPTVEGGDKCTLINTLQEISVFYRRKERKAQDEFWKNVRKALSSEKDSSQSYDLRENERLSAIALIKRLFVREDVTERAIGWRFPIAARKFPSTSYMAVIPWLSQVVKKAPEEGQAYAEAAQKCGVELSEYGRRFSSLRSSSYSFINLQGQAFYKTYLENDRNFKNEEATPEKRQEMREAYQQLIAKMNGKGPNSYFAMLLMDGDRLGALLQQEKKGEKGVGKKLSQALARFTREIKDLVAKHDGVTIYAGGDDLLAMFPMTQALPAAVKIREEYLTSFKVEMGTTEKKATISGAIVYSHFQSPLQGVLQFAHQILDEEAKERSGRDSLAIGVWKSSGIDLVWSAPWERVYDNGKRLTYLEKIAQEFSAEGSEVTNSFLYKLRELYEQSPKFDPDPIKNREILLDLIAADLVRIKGVSQLNIDEAKKRIKPLLNLCFRSRYTDQKTLVEDDDFHAAGALLVRFLAQMREER